jgi:putative protease
MAVHNDAGLQAAEDLGIRRVILSRELPLDRIRALRERHPGIELEVFIHGALCYSFSGICLASWALTGRSGNRGDCAQICRSSFTETSPDEGRNGRFFSSRDLFLGREVLKLAAAGIDGLKIEGRMKSPEYVFNVTRLYREILDKAEGLPESEYQELVRRTELTFSREKTTGWFLSPTGSRLIEPGFPGHRGSHMGTVEAVQGREVRLSLGADLSLRDGLAFFFEGAREPVIFSVSRIHKAGRETRFARAGDTVSVEVPRDATASMPPVGTEIRHLSSRSLDLPQPREASFPACKVPVDLEISLGSGGELAARAERFPRPLLAAFPPFTRTVTVERAARKKPFREILARLFAESGGSLFSLRGLSFRNETGFPDDEVFVPPSELKRVKNELYAFMDEAFARAAGAREDQAPRRSPLAESPLSASDLDSLSHRQHLVVERCAPIPFACGDPAQLRPADLFFHAGYRWLPLPPVIMDSDPWIAALGQLADTNPGLRFAVGCNNLSHLGMASALAGKPNLWFFADYLLYAANARTLALLLERVPRLLFAYEWIENECHRVRWRGDEPGHDLLTAAAAAPALPLVRLSPDFRPPLFYSLGCFARHVLNDGKCFDDCPKDFVRDLRQGRNRFQLVVRDCVTYLFAESR